MWCGFAKCSKAFCKEKHLLNGSICCSKPVYLSFTTNVASTDLPLTHGRCTMAPPHHVCWLWNCLMRIIQMVSLLYHGEVMGKDLPFKEIFSLTAKMVVIYPTLSRQQFQFSCSRYIHTILLLHTSTQCASTQFMFMTILMLRWNGCQQTLQIVLE